MFEVQTRDCDGVIKFYQSTTKSVHLSTIKKLAFQEQIRTIYFDIDGIRYRVTQEDSVWMVLDLKKWCDTRYNWTHKKVTNPGTEGPEPELEFEGSLVEFLH